MPVNHELKCIFVHIPKAAGTSIESALNMHGEKKDIGLTPYRNQIPDQKNLYGGKLTHLSAFEIKQKIKEFDEYFKFTIVRNPFSRVLSHYCWLDRKWTQENIITPEEFRKWIKTCDWSHRHLLPQCEYLYEYEVLLVDYVGKFEELSSSWKYICTKLGIKKELPIRMKSRHTHYSEYYDDESKKLVAEKFAKDLEYFNYAFEENDD